MVIEKLGEQWAPENVFKDWDTREKDGKSAFLLLRRIVLYLLASMRFSQLDPPR
jgi:hypothetical protein